MSHPLFCQVCVCTCVCSCECTLSHTLEHAHAHSPVLRKSKIAVSLNSFPLAARTAFVLQTKRKRNETEGSEEAGEGGREGARAKEQTEKEGNSKGEREGGTASNTERQAGEPGGKCPSIHARTRLPDITKTSMTGCNSSPSLPWPPGKGPSRQAHSLRERKISPNKLAPSDDMPPAQGPGPPPPTPLPIPVSEGSSALPLPGSHPHCPPSALGTLGADRRHFTHRHFVSHTAWGCTAQRHSPPERTSLSSLSESPKPPRGSPPALRFPTYNPYTAR